MRLIQYSSRGNHGKDCLQDDALYSDGFLTFLLTLWSVLRAAWLDIFALIIFTLSRSPRCIMCYVMLGIALQYHYGHPRDRDYSKNFLPALKKNLRTKERANFGGRERFGVMRFYCRLQQTNCNYFPQSQ